MSDTTKEQPEAVAPVAPVAEAQPAKIEETTASTVGEEATLVASADNTKEIDATTEKPTEEPTEKLTEKTTEVKSDTKPENKAETTTRHKKNKPKSDASTLPITDDPEAIRAQVEFYFGDANLPTDKFMWENTGGPENKPVPLKSICKFNRMHRFQPYEAIVAALKESQFLQVTEVDGEEMISRKVPYKLNPDGAKQRFASSVYIKGFGEEQSSTQFDIEAWVAQFGTADKIKLRRDDENNFKGSIFVEFSTPELAKKFVALDPAPKFQGKDLVIMTKSDYTEMKMEQIRNGEIEPSKGRKSRFYEGRGGGKRRGSFNKGGKDRENGKHGRENGFRGGRGGRGRGRGRGRGGYGGRDRDDRSKAAAEKAEKAAAPRSVNGVKEPEIKVTTEKANGKRAREEDAGEKAPPAKKVSTGAQ